MSKRNFKSAPDMGKDFREVDEFKEPPLTPAFDAARWEPTEEPDLPKPSEKHLTLDYTPGGTLEQEVHTQLDDQTRAALRAAMQQQIDPRDDMRSLGDQWEGVARKMNDRWEGQAKQPAQNARSWEELLDQETDRGRSLDRER